MNNVERKYASYHNKHVYSAPPKIEGEESYISQALTGAVITSNTMPVRQMPVDIKD